MFAKKEEREPSPKFTPDRVDELLQADDRRKYESDIDLMMRRLLKDKAISDDQRRGYERWWVADPKKPDASSRSGESDLVEILEETLDHERAIHTQEKKPPG